MKAPQAEIVVCCAPGNQCRAGQSLQQQAEEAVEAVEVCRMLRKEGKWDGETGGTTHQWIHWVSGGAEQCEEWLP